MNDKFQAVCDYLLEKQGMNDNEMPERIVSGHAHLLLGNQSKALQEFAASNCELIDEPFHSHVAAMISSIYIQKQEFDEALKWANRAIKRNREAPAGYFFRGMVFRNLDQHRDAILDFEMAVALGDENVSLVKELVCAYVDDRRVDAALSLISQLPTDTMDHPVIAYEHARVTELDWRNESRIKDAIRLYEYALTLDPIQTYRDRILKALNYLIKE